MKRSSKIVSLGLVSLAALLVASGCAKAHKSDSAVLQGTWKGQEAVGNATGVASLVLSGTNLELQGADPREWYKATFTLLDDKTPKQMLVTITACPNPQYVGKTACAIYQIQDGALTIAARAPGDTNVPTRFDEPDLRKIVFRQ